MSQELQIITTTTTTTTTQQFGLDLGARATRSTRLVMGVWGGGSGMGVNYSVQTRKIAGTRVIWNQLISRKTIEPQVSSLY